MTTQPEARLFHLNREESVLVRSGAEEPATAAAPDDRSDSQPQVRVEVRRGSSQRSEATDEAAAKAARASDPASLFEPDDDDDGFAGMRFPGATAEKAAGKDQAKTDEEAQAGDAEDDGDLAAEIEAVKAEGLSPRQLRVANRIARSKGIEAASDEEAVVLLRRQGIDPLHRSALRKVVAEEGKRASRSPSSQVPSLFHVHEESSVPERSKPRRVVPLPDPGPDQNLPAERRDQPGLPSREEMTEERRAAEIQMIQRDIAQRRRRRLTMLFVRLAAFVAIPTLVTGWYYFAQATPLYSTESAFQIQKSENMSSGSLGSIFAGTQLATNPDSVAVQSYLGSRDAMQKLDREIGFKKAFQGPEIDPLLRLSEDASDSDAYKLYKNSVKIGYDPTEGMIEMEVIAPTPELSEQYSRALISYAEDQVDQMTARLREDQMTGAIASYHDAEAKVEEAQGRILELQRRLGVLDPTAESSAAMTQISSLEQELTSKQLELGQLQANLRPNPSRVKGVQGDIKRLEEMIAARRADLTESSSAKASLAAVTGELRVAEGDLATRQQLLAAAAAQMESARIEANKQVRYVSLAVAPVAPDQPTYPKAVQNTIVAFLIFAGIYLMLSLTASILREQVTS